MIIELIEMSSSYQKLIQHQCNMLKFLSTILTYFSLFDDNEIWYLLMMQHLTDYHKQGLPKPQNHPAWHQHVSVKSLPLQNKRKKYEQTEIVSLSNNYLLTP